MANNNPFDQQTAIPGVKEIIVVGSGKGGVGKSTISANLACALAKLGKNVGLLDADIYGPSQPRLFGLLGQRPQVDSKQKIHPLQQFGVKLMSIGFLVEEGAAVIWRGPMLFKAMDQFLRDVFWGDLDYLIIDLPPGTGDVQLSLVQKVPISTAIMVTTPQNISLGDVKKSVDMFERVGVSILGFVENMAGYYNQDTHTVQELFPRGEIQAYVDAKKSKILVSLPFDTNLAKASEMGIPYVDSFPNGPLAPFFYELAKTCAEKQNPPSVTSTGFGDVEIRS